MAWMTAAGNAPFVVALLVMVGLALAELVALATGVGLNDVVDDLLLPSSAGSDAGTGMEATGSEVQGVVGRFLAWLHIGKVPVLMVLIILLALFGLIGLVGQNLARTLFGAPAPTLLAVPLAFAVALPPVRWCSGLLARILPGDESSAIDLDQLVGRTGTVVGGTARAGLPAQARVTDRFGTDHYVLAEPEDAAETFPAGAVVLLVRRTGGGRFAVIANPNPALVDGT
ncbi:MAG: YqiJ family protein [Pseudoxanthomonas sp.]|nr:YqiJ family protein [Pseudoxanthomonas sp.]